MNSRGFNIFYQGLYSIIFVWVLLGFFLGNMSLDIGVSVPFVDKLVTRLLSVIWLIWTAAAFIAGGKWQVKPVPIVFLAVLLPLLFSDYTSRRFGFWIDSRLGFIAILCGTVFALIYLAKLDENVYRRIRRFINFKFLLFLQVLIAIVFIKHADGRLLFSDDHPSFLYRLQMLAEHFPRIPFYNPEWNGGYLAREFFPSGVLNIFFLSFPIISYFENFSTLEAGKNYTLLIPYLFIFIVPWSVYLSGRILKLGRTTSVVAGIFALGPSLGYFEWLLKYGTLGFCLSAGLIPLCFALAFRLALDRRRPNALHVIGLLLVSFCTLSWTLSFIVLLPLLLVALWNFNITFGRDRASKLLLFVIAFVAFNGPWMLIFIRESNVSKFVQESSLPGTSVKTSRPRATILEEAKRKYDRALTQSEEEKYKHIVSTSQSGAKKFAKKSKKRIRALIGKVNPLILLLSVSGFFLIRRRFLRQTLCYTILWLLLIAAIGDEVKPQLELKRMIIPCSLLMCLLSAKSFVYLLRRSLLTWKSKTGMFSKSLSFTTLVIMLGCLIITPLCVSAMYLNRSDERYTFEPSDLHELVNAIKTYGGEGRTFFLGFILHELGALNYASQDGGHVAPLTKWSGKPLYASHFYHARWSSVDPIPSWYRRQGKKGIEEFLDLFNVTAVITFKREWRDYCQTSENYEEVYFGGRFRVFKRKQKTSGYFLSGDGKVEVLKDGLRVFPKTEKSVLKFRSIDNLKVTPQEGVTLSSTFAFEDEVGGGKTEAVDFISLEVSEEVIRKGGGVLILFGKGLL